MHLSFASAVFTVAKKLDGLGKARFNLSPFGVRRKTTPQSSSAGCRVERE